MILRTASFLVGGLFALILFSGTGCGRSSKMEDGASGGMEMPMVEEMGDDPDSVNHDRGARESAGGGGMPEVIDRKIIYTADVRLVLKKISFEKFEQEIEKLIETYKGRKSVASASRDQGEKRAGRWVIRIPVKYYSEFIKKLKEMGVPEKVEESSKDVTAEYVDLKARLENQKKLEQRILGVLEEVRGNIQEVLNVERELARVRELIERLEGQRRVLMDRVEMTTVTVYAREDEDYEPPQALSFGEHIVDVWKSSLNALKGFFKGLVLAMVSAVPWLVVGVPGVYLMVWLVRRWRTRPKERPGK